MLVRDRWNGEKSVFNFAQMSMVKSYKLELFLLYAPVLIM